MATPQCSHSGRFCVCDLAHVLLTKELRAQANMFGYGAAAKEVHGPLDPKNTAAFLVATMVSCEYTFFSREFPEGVGYEWASEVAEILLLEHGLAAKVLTDPKSSSDNPAKYIVVALNASVLRLIEKV